MTESSNKKMATGYDDRAIGPPGTATVVMIVVVSIVILIASGYMIYTYSSVRPAPPSQAASTTAH